MTTGRVLEGMILPRVKWGTLRRIFRKGITSSDLRIKRIPGCDVARV